MPTLRTTISILHDYGKRSTLHGLSHMYQTTDVWRKLFWTVMTLVGCCACAYHIVATVTNYLESPITSVYRDKGVVHTFPDVTICSLKPASESLLKIPEQRQVLFDHLRINWNFFDNWMPEERRRGANESQVEYKDRLRRVFKKYMDVFWVSEDTRDFGLSDMHMLLHCSFKGVRCDSSNFKLIMDHRYWNCYDFVPPMDLRDVDGTDWESGLVLILFTDSNFEEPNETLSYQRQKSASDERTQPYTLEEYLTSGGRTINQVLTGNDWDADGFHVSVHRDGEHPMTATVGFDVANTASTTIEYSMVQSLSMNRPPHHVCHEGETPTEKFVKFFGGNSKEVGLRKFSITQAEAVAQEKQQLLMERCGCFTHKLPFKFNTSVLCYFAPHGERQNPSEQMLQRIHCHDAEYKRVESLSQELMKKTQNFTPCSRWRLHAFKADVPWPRYDQLIDFVNSIFLPHFLNLKERRSGSHHLLSKSDLNRSTVVLRHLLEPSCRPESNSSSIVDAWCVSRRKLLNNVAKVWIKPDSPQAGYYEENYSYDWPEALSEVGGIFGLWMGISLLSVFEFIELIVIILQAKSMNRHPSIAGGTVPAELQSRLLHLMTSCHETANATTGQHCQPASHQQLDYIDQ